MIGTALGSSVASSYLAETENAQVSAKVSVSDVV